MESNLVCLGFVVTKQGEIMGVRLCDLETKETSLIEIKSFNTGLSNCIKILNVELEDEKYKFYGGNRNYSIYNINGNVKKNGKILLYEKNNKWLTILQDGKILDTYDWVRNICRDRPESDIRRVYLKAINGTLNNTLVIPNKVNENSEKNVINKDTNRQSDITILKSKIARDYGSELAKHIETRIKLKESKSQIKFNEVVLSIEGSSFVGYIDTDDGWKLQKISEFCKYNVKTVLGTVIGENDTYSYHQKPLILLSDNYYDGSKDFEFIGINYNGHTEYTTFKLSDILYVRDPNKWCGNKEILNDKLSKAYLMERDPDDINIELVIYNKEIKKLTVVSSYAIEYYGRISAQKDEYSLHLDFYYEKLSFDDNFIRDGDLLYPLIASMLFKPNEAISNKAIINNAFLDGIVYIDKYKFEKKEHLEPYKLSEIDKADKSLYSEVKIGTKDKVNVYNCSQLDFVTIYNNLRDAKIRTVYKTKEAEYNILYYRRTYPGGKSDDYRSYNFGALYSRLNSRDLTELLNSLEINKVYKDLPLGMRNERDYVTRDSKYTMICKESLIYIGYNGRNRVATINFEGTHINISDKQKLYNGIVDANSVVYFIYRVVLKYDKTIPRCKEQLMYNGEIEDLLNDLVIEEIIDKKEDIVKVYVGKYKIEMKLSDAISQLLAIYKSANSEKEIAFRKKLEIMKMTADINSVKGNIVIDGSLNGRSITIPKDVDSIVLQGTKDITINKLVITKNIRINGDKFYNIIRVNELNVSDKANDMVQKFGRNTSKFEYKHCKIRNLNITGKGLYELILTIFWVNDKVAKGIYISDDKPLSRSKEVKLVKLHQSYDDINKVLSSIHGIYELDFNEKSLNDLVEYIESLKDIEKMRKITKSDSYIDIGRYIMMIAYLLSSYKFDKKYYSSLMDIGISICEGDLYVE